MSEDLDCEDPDQPRSATEIAKRAIVLHCIVAAAHGVSKIDISEWLRSEQLYEELSPRERRFMETAHNSKRDMNQALWRVEAQVAILWAIRKIDRMDDPTHPCNTRPLVDAIPDLFSPTKEFIETASLRSTEEIEEEYERIYDIHCEIGSAKRKAIPINYDLGIVQERHYAMNWITGYCGQAWDEITTDT